MGFILSILTGWGVPEGLRKPIAYVGAALALFALIAVLRGCYDRSVIKEHEREVAEQIRKKTKAGEKAASEAVDETITEVEAGNERARDAAEGSDDPLGDALRELR